jgi:sigma-70-like protein
MDTAALVERARGGDVEAFTTLVQRYQRLAHGSAMALVHRADIARDVVQDAFLAASSSPSHTRAPGTPRSDSACRRPRTHPGQDRDDRLGSTAYSPGAPAASGGAGKEAPCRDS